jgi:tetratricopeptide (TPR) repeat protein
VGLCSFVLAVNPFHLQAYLRRARAHGRLGEAQQAIDDYGLALSLIGLDNQHRRERTEASVCNNLAWLYLTGPQELRDPNKALPLAQKAVRIVPENSLYRNTLGVVYYRLGQWDAAVETLQHSLQNSKNEAHDLFFLAMSYQQLGEATKARDCYERALRWWKAQGPLMPSDDVEELSAFRAEADALLKKPGEP